MRGRTSSRRRPAHAFPHLDPALVLKEQDHVRPTIAGVPVVDDLGDGVAVDVEGAPWVHG